MAGADSIFLGGATVYLAPVGTDFPITDVATAPAAEWYKVGTLGDKQYSEDGVTFRRNVSVTDVYGLGGTMILKSAISQAGAEVEFSVFDMDPAQMLVAMGGLETNVTETTAGSGIPGTTEFVVPTSPTPILKAVLVRYPMSSFGPQWVTDIRIQVAMQAGGGEATISKSGAMMFQHIWKALEPASGDAVVVVQQSAAPTA